jgi:hypothetical protein
MRRWRHWLWNAPKHHLHEIAVVVMDTLAKEQLGFHQLPVMAL